MKPSSHQAESRVLVRHLALGKVAEHEVDLRGSASVTEALSAVLGVEVRSADMISVQAVQGGAARTRVPSVGTGTLWRQHRAGFPRRLFCQELAVLLDAGIPLLESLQTLREKELDAHIAEVLSDVCQALQEGHTLAGAMRFHPDAFGQLLVASIDAGSRTGHTATVLRQHAAYLAWAEGLRSQLVSAMVYPVILVSASLLVIAFLTVFVIPRFADIYEGLGADLPWLSGMLLATGLWVAENPGAVLLGVAAFAVAVASAWQHPGLRKVLAEWTDGTCRSG